jgi:hypothetical protein
VSFLRFVGTLALAFWIGGLAVLGAIAASATFEVLQAHDPVTGRQLAAVVFGAIFQRFNYAAIGAGAVLLLSLGVRAALGPRPRRFGVRMWVAAAMFAGAIASAVLIAPRVESIRASVSGPVADLPDSDSRKVAFGRWHALSTGLMLVTIVAGIGLIWTELNDRH